MQIDLTTLDRAVAAGRLPAIDAVCQILGVLDAPHLAEVFERVAMRYRAPSEGTTGRDRPEWDAQQKNRNFASDLGVHLSGKQRAAIWRTPDAEIVDAVEAAHAAGFPLTSPECTDRSAFIEAGNALGIEPETAKKRFYAARKIKKGNEK